MVSPGTSSNITIVAGDGQSAAVNTSYASQLKASVQDAQGNGIPNVMVTFSPPATGPSVSFSGPVTVATDSTGVAAISVTANSQVGSVQVNAAAPASRLRHVQLDEPSRARQASSSSGSSLPARLRARSSHRRLRCN